MARRVTFRSAPQRAVWVPDPQRSLSPVSGTEGLLWAAGNTRGVNRSGNYYQGSKSIPRPLLLRRVAGQGPLQMPALEALALTKMDWNNDALYDPMPVTVLYSQCLARAIARAGTPSGHEFAYRLFM